MVSWKALHPAEPSPGPVTWSTSFLSFVLFVLCTSEIVLMLFFSSPSVSMSRLFVGGLPAAVDREELEKVFGRFGRLDDVWVARKPPGFAFVEFSDSRSAENALRNLNNTPQFGTTIRVEFSTRSDNSRRRSSPSSRRGPPPPRSDRDRFGPPRNDYPPPQRSFRGSPPRMYRSPPRSSFRMSPPPPQRSYRPSPPPAQRGYYNRSPQRSSYRSSPPPMRPVYRDPLPARPAYRGPSPPARRYEFESTSRPMTSRDYSAAAPVYAGRSPVRVPRYGCRCCSFLFFPFHACRRSHRLFSPALPYTLPSSPLLAGPVFS